jgi:hypothetical protein
LGVTTEAYASLSFSGRAFPKEDHFVDGTRFPAEEAGRAQANPDSYREPQSLTQKKRLAFLNRSNHK